MVRSVFLILILSLTMSGCGGKVFDGVDSSSPHLRFMPDISADMENAGYWISRSRNPDQVIMTPLEIDSFNTQTAGKHSVINVSNYDDNKSGTFIKNSILILYQGMIKRSLFNEYGVGIADADYAPIRDQFQLEQLTDAPVEITFGVMVQRTSQKILPTDRHFYSKGNGFFDRLQMSSLDIGTPVAILWRSKDGEWLYVRSSLTVGWVPVATVARCEKRFVPLWEQPDTFIITTKYRTPVYSNLNQNKYLTWLPLGTKLPYDDIQNRLIVPIRNRNGVLEQVDGYTDSANLHMGYLPYTTRNILNLSFEMLHAPYGWGGMNSDQDCSSFLIQVFGAVGVNLPRNSAQQGQSGTPIYTNKDVTTFDTKNTLLLKGLAGGTVLQMPGHVMLYVGNVGGSRTLYTPYGLLKR